mmetsp:Transcript_25374/g.70604  ORF Transcript_25374/g.70604 Transcript_25374/m.70604 type:complete len:273 (+) Transcript_25374:479-1297(+)
MDTWISGDRSMRSCFLVFAQVVAEEASFAASPETLGEETRTARPFAAVLASPTSASSLKVVPPERRRILGLGTSWERSVERNSVLSSLRMVSRSSRTSANSMCSFAAKSSPRSSPLRASASSARIFSTSASCSSIRRACATTEAIASRRPNSSARARLSRSRSSAARVLAASTSFAPGCGPRTHCGSPGCIAAAAVPEPGGRPAAYVAAGLGGLPRVFPRDPSGKAAAVPKFGAFLRTLSSKCSDHASSKVEQRRPDGRWDNVAAVARCAPA